MVVDIISQLTELWISLLRGLIEWPGIRNIELSIFIIMHIFSVIFFKIKQKYTGLKILKNSFYD